MGEPAAKDAKERDEEQEWIAQRLSEGHTPSEVREALGDLHTIVEAELAGIISPHFAEWVVLRLAEEMAERALLRMKRTGQR